MIEKLKKTGHYIAHAIYVTGKYTVPQILRCNLVEILGTIVNALLIFAAVYPMIENYKHSSKMKGVMIVLLRLICFLLTKFGTAFKLLNIT